MAWLASARQDETLTLAWLGHWRGTNADTVSKSAALRWAAERYFAAARAGTRLLSPWIYLAGDSALDLDTLVLSAKLGHRLRGWASAERLYRRALKQRPQSPSLRNNLALVLAEQGRKLE